MTLRLHRAAIALVCAASAVSAPAITLDAVSSSGEGAGTNLTWQHTVSAGNYRMLVVAVGIENDADQPASSVTYGARSLLPVPGSRAAYAGSKANATELWYLPSPNVGTSAVTVTFSGPVAGSAGGALSLFGVNQAAPEAVSASAGAGGDGLYAQAITTRSDRAWVVDVVNNGERLSTGFTPGAGQTERWDLLGNDEFRLAASTREVTPAGVVTDRWECVTATPSREAQSMAAFAPLQPPVAAITSPLEGETVSRAGLTITATASGGVGVTNVAFYADGGFLGSDGSVPYSWKWDAAPLGDHTLTAVAYDAAGVSGTSPAVHIHVTNNLPPRVSITRPANGMVVSTNVAIAATASDDVAVTNVCFYDGSTRLGCDDTSPYACAWNGAPPGPHTLSAVAWDDTGRSATSTVEVTVILQRAQHVVLISVDGMGSYYVSPLLASGVTNELTTFKRIQAEGSGTLNARDDADYAVTLPNHVTMVTGRGVLGAAGHGWTGNGDPAPTDTIAKRKGSYVASAFDVAHDNGLRTGIWSGKSKFSLFQQSYGAVSGALDSTGPDNGRDKIDYDKVVASISASALTTDFTNQMKAAPFHFSFFHYQDPDAAGHATGWSTNPASVYAATLKRVDTQVGRILQMVDRSPELQGVTTVILTADHGGHGYTHGDTTDPLDFTIPFYVWGAGVRAGGDLYAMNWPHRPAPGPDANPRYTGPQPVRNGDAANLALYLLGLDPVPGSTIDKVQDLRVDTTPPGRISVRIEAGVPVVEWMGSNDCFFAVDFSPSLAPAAAWSNVPGLAPVPGVDGLMSVGDTNGSPRGFYRVRLTP